MATKPRRKSRTVKKPPAKTSITKLRQLARMLSAADLHLNPPAKVQQLDYFDALDLLQESHPVHAEAHRIFLGSRKLKKQAEDTRELKRRFQGGLPKSLISVWLEVERRVLALRTLDCIIHYNLGVEAGFSLNLVDGSLNHQGIDTAAIPRDAMLIISTIIAQIAKEVPLTR